MKTLIVVLLTVLGFSLHAESPSWTAKPENLSKVGREWGLGYKHKDPVGKLYSMPGADVPMKSFNLEMFPHEHTPTMDQGSCGSCVVFSFTYNFEESLRLRGIKIPSLSQQHLMNCGTGMQCNGAYGEEIAQDLVKLKTLHTAVDYPYTATSGSCKTKTGQRYGQIIGEKSIDPSVKNILAALYNGQPVSVGIAAGGSFGSYSGGVYTACNATGVNHYVVIVGVDCETAVDAQGFCKFNADGNLPPGVGTFLVQNSWGNNFGVEGRITMKQTKPNGQRCHAIASPGDAQILDIGVPMPDDNKPVSYVIENTAVKFENTYKPGCGYTADDAKREFQKAADALAK